MATGVSANLQFEDVIPSDRRQYEPARTDTQITDVDFSPVMKIGPKRVVFWRHPPIIM